MTWTDRTLPIAQMLRDAAAAWAISGGSPKTRDVLLLGDMACHVRALAAEVERLDAAAIKWALDRIASLGYTLQMTGYQRDEHREAIDNLRVIRVSVLARWERSLQEIVDAAERAKRKVSQERAEVTP